MPLLYFHRVLREPPPSDAISPDVQHGVTGECLSALMEHNRDRLEDWEALATSGMSAKSRGIGMSFDDGYTDFKDIALPILEQFGTRVLLFVCPGFVDGYASPNEYVLGSVVKYSTTLYGPDAEVWACATAEEKWDCYRRVARKLKRLDPAERERVLASIRQENVDEADIDDEPRYLRWSELRELDGHPLVEIGAHTVRHPYLPALDRVSAWTEIADSKRLLEEQLNRRVRCFAYPYGGQDATIRRMVRMAGFEYAFTTRARGLGRMACPRVDGAIRGKSVSRVP